MQDNATIIIASDFHYAGPAERQRRGYESRGIPSFWLRLAARAYRRFVWLADPLAHYRQLQHFLASVERADLAVLNGDYSCDTGFVGVSDDAALSSAGECLDQIRARFGADCTATIGDHELGKFSLFGGQGGLRLASWRRCLNELGLQPFWERRIGHRVLMGVTSSLLALPVYAREALEPELPEWQRLREQHRTEIAKAFERLDLRDKVILFCHDPTALPFLAEEEPVAKRFGQIEHTIIGHLHSRAVLKASRILAGIPSIRFLGNTARRMSTALNRAKAWKPFNVTLCPSPSGIQLLKDGGYLRMKLELNDPTPARIESIKLPWPRL